MTASKLKVLAAAALLIAGCSSSSSPNETELAAVLGEAADREGVPPGECRDACLTAALAVFDECTAESDDREACFAKAIRSFFDCVKECPPPTCEDRCEAKARQHYMECMDEDAQLSPALARLSEDTEAFGLLVKHKGSSEKVAAKYF